MNYKLRTQTNNEKEEPIKGAFFKMISLMSGEKKNLIISGIAILGNSLMALLGPLLVGYTVDKYVVTKDYHGVVLYSLLLLLIYLVGVITNYIQVRYMGRVGQQTLWRLRNDLFLKLQELPVAFFNENKAGDLISRLNNDTDKLNQFFSQTLMQFTGNAVIVVGAAIFIVAINWRLGLAALVPAVVLLFLTQFVSPFIKKINLKSLQAEGGLSAEVQESMEHFKVIIAFNRRDYFEEKFKGANENNYKTSLLAGFGNNFFGPVFDFAGNLAQLIVLAYGIYLIIHGQLLIGVLISYILYLGRFYDPLRTFANFWPTLQIALAGWDRISEILNLKSNLNVVDCPKKEGTESIMKFENVSFHYSDAEKGVKKEILKNVSFDFEKGKTYALVGPTGGGKTTTASLIARLYDPSEGIVYLDGVDIRSYSAKERTKKIGFILQEPFLFTGTVKENILYGNEELMELSDEKFLELLKNEGLNDLVSRFEDGLNEKIEGNSDSQSLGQKQLIAFMRAMLRKPEILILDEATANIDTVTEKLLSEILNKLSKNTTKVIIAHRLNTIENADEIFFVNGGTVTAAGSMEHAVDMLLHGKRES